MICFVSSGNKWEKGCKLNVILSQMQARECGNKPVNEQLLLAHPWNQLPARVYIFKLLRIAVELARISKHKQVIALLLLRSVSVEFAAGTGPIGPLPRE